MKKFFFLAVAATAMLAACNKTEIVPTSDPQEISFVAVNKVATKAPVDGITFLTGDNMDVVAYLKHYSLMFPELQHGQENVTGRCLTLLLTSLQ